MRIEDREQGLEMECLYCTKIYPELREKECPVCKGARFIFQPAQMMDVETSERAIFTHLSEFLQNYYKHELDVGHAEKDFEKKKKLAETAKNDAINLIKKIHIYNFNLSEALIHLVHEIDMNYDLRKY